MAYLLFLVVLWQKYNQVSIKKKFMRLALVAILCFNILAVTKSLLGNYSDCIAEMFQFKLANRAAVQEIGAPLIPTSVIQEVLKYYGVEPPPQ
jgi:hypothetical protein